MAKTAAIPNDQQLGLIRMMAGYLIGPHPLKLQGFSSIKFINDNSPPTTGFVA